MFQDFALFPHLTILDNVAFGLKSLGRSEARAEARAALERVALAHYAGEYPHILSGGEQQRVALARAIAPRPSVLLMDEPFSGLDPELREKMREETLAILHETRATSIVVTHDAEEAMRMGDRVALMRRGRIVQTGNALDLYRAPRDIFAARTFSDLNELTARVEQGSAATPLGRFFANGLPDGAEAIVCVRQRGVRLLEAGQGVPGRSSRATCRCRARRSGSASMPARSSCSRPTTAGDPALKHASGTACGLARFAAIVL
jgi:iron(III) transport system ATP-binding protein